MPYAVQGVALTVAVQATVRSGDADPTSGTISLAIRKWKQGESENGYYYTGSAWQAGAATVTSTQGDLHTHTAVVDATRMAGLQGWDFEARPADAGAIGPANWYHVGSDQLADILAEILADTSTLPADPASETNVDANETQINALQSDVTAVKAKTDNLPTDPADQSLLETAISAAETNIRGTDSDDLKTLSDQLDNLKIPSVGSPFDPTGTLP